MAPIRSSDVITRYGGARLCARSLYHTIKHDIDVYKIIFSIGGGAEEPPRRAQIKQNYNFIKRMGHLYFMWLMLHTVINGSLEPAYLLYISTYTINFESQASSLSVYLYKACAWMLIHDSNLFGIWYGTYARARLLSIYARNRQIIICLRATYSRAILNLSKKKCI